MARFKYYRYGINEETKLPKNGYIRTAEDYDGGHIGIAVYNRMLSTAEVKKHNLDDLNKPVKNITRLRLNMGMMQSELSQITGISVRTIQGWELSGMNRASLTNGKLVADALHCTMEELIDDDDLN